MKLFAPTQGHFQATVRVPTQKDAMRTLRNVNGAQIGAWKIEILPLPASDSNADKLRYAIEIDTRFVRQASDFVMLEISSTFMNIHRC